ncbi:MAG: Flp pilus assembly protein CpaB [Candidatus Eremiobacteraeota bacterium]|nr:Flp pilus assembly protein CpaB [Candidatus Eremiobacteraeota bacterium]
MNTRRITLIVAVVLAIGTGILTLRYLSSIQQTQVVEKPQAELKQILVAGKDIPARSRITPDMLTRVSRPANEIEPGALADPKQAQGDIALISIPSGSTITETKVGRPAEVGLTVRLKPGMRAVSISVDKVKAVSGLLQPGDRVDVIASIPKVPGSQPRAVTIIRGAIVLALNAQMETAGATPSPDSQNLTTITLGVTPEQADLLMVADLNTTLRLALRSPQEPVRSMVTQALYFPDTAGAGESKDIPPLYPVAAAPPVGVQPPPVGAKPGGGSPVTVIDGDKVVSGAR